MTTILAFIAAIAILVFVHEMGHYLAARQCGVQVLRFSVGFGTPLLKWTSRKSGVEWVVAAIPLGGYVRMNDASFDSKRLAARSWIVFAGPLANLIFAALAYALLFSMDREEPSAVMAAPPPASFAQAQGLEAGDLIVAVNGRSVRSFTDLRWRIAQTVVGDGDDVIRLQVARAAGGQAEISLPLDHPSIKAEGADPLRVMQVLGLAPLSRGVSVSRLQAGSPGERAGLRPGDRIVEVDGRLVLQPEQVISAVQQSAGRPLELLVSDGGPAERVVLQPEAGTDGVYRIGAVVSGDIDSVTVSDGPLEAAWGGVVRTWEMSTLTFQAIGRMILGEISWRQVSGPVTIADVAGKSAAGGLQSFIGFLALISISIAVLNLLPIPMLDGGHLLYYLWELVRGQPLPLEVQDAGRRIGLALILLLTVVALTNDFTRIAGW